MGSETSVAIALIKNSQGYQATTGAYAEYEGIGAETKMEIARYLAWVDGGKPVAKGQPEQMEF